MQKRKTRRNWTKKREEKKGERECQWSPISLHRFSQREERRKRSSALKKKRERKLTAIPALGTAEEGKGEGEKHLGKSNR